MGCPAVKVADKMIVAWRLANRLFQVSGEKNCWRRRM